MKLKTYGIGGILGTVLLVSIYIAAKTGYLGKMAASYFISKPGTETETDPVEVIKLLNRPKVFYTDYETYKGTDGKEYYNNTAYYILQDSAIENIITQLNTQFQLPCNIPIQFKHIGTENAFYFPQERSIWFSLEMVEQINAYLQPFFAPEESADLQTATVDAVAFILLHEIGHCLIDLYELPSIGNQEYEADNFACYMLLTGNERAEQMALTGATYFYQSYISGNGAIAWDEHPFDDQRYYNIMRKLYGKNPAKYAPFLESTGQAINWQSAPYEYENLIRSWDKNLKDHVKQTTL